MKGNLGSVDAFVVVFEPLYQLFRCTLYSNFFMLSATLLLPWKISGVFIIFIVCRYIII